MSMVACIEGSGLDLYSSRRGMYSLAGEQCVDCGVGKQPASNYGTCVDCEAGEYSSGDLCRRCPPGTKPSGNKATCVSCQLQGASAYSTDGTQCQSCSPGEQPNAGRTGCEACRALSTASNADADTLAGIIHQINASCTVAYAA